MSISHCYCSDYMTKPTQFGDEPKIFWVVMEAISIFNLYRDCMLLVKNRKA